MAIGTAVLSRKVGSRNGTPSEQRSLIPDNNALHSYAARGHGLSRFDGNVFYSGLSLQLQFSEQVSFF